MQTSPDAPHARRPRSRTVLVVALAVVLLGAVVVVQGAGPIGLLAAQHARHAGAGVVMVVEPNPERRRAATELGFTEVHEPGEAFRAQLLTLTDDLGADVLYECTGAAGLFQSSAELVRRGEHVYVSDLGLSTNGTRVNGRPVGRRLLVDGDVLSFGSCRTRIGGLSHDLADDTVELRRNGLFVNID